MATIAKCALGTLLKIGDGGGSEVFTTIAEVSAIKGIAPKVATTKVTAHDTGPWEQKIATLIDAGQVSFDLNYNNHATQGPGSGLYYDMINRTLRNFQLVIPTTVAKTISFAAYVTDFPFDLPTDAAIKVSCTLEISGQPTWA